MFHRIRETLSSAKEAIFLPVGVDHEFDDKCEKSFLNFLDVVYNFLLASFVISAVLVGYFFITHELV